MTIKATPPILGGGDITFDNTSPGQSYSVVTTEDYYDTGTWSSFVVHVLLLTSAGTSPTLDVKVEHAAVDPATASHNPWQLLKAFAQFDGPAAKEIMVPDGSSVSAFGRWVRIVAQVGGADHVFTGRIDISPRG